MAIQSWSWAQNAGEDLIDGGPGSDSISGGADQDWLLGGDGNDVIWAGDSNDVVSGGAGDDYLVGGPGFDQIWGGWGDDVFLVLRSDGPDVLLGEEGVDTVHFADRLMNELTDATGLAGDGSYRVAFSDGTQWTLFGIEYLAFSDSYRIIA